MYSCTCEARGAGVDAGAGAVPAGLCKGDCSHSTVVLPGELHLGFLEEEGGLEDSSGRPAGQKGGDIRLIFTGRH